MRHGPDNCLIGFGSSSEAPEKTGPYGAVQRPCMYDAPTVGISESKVQDAFASNYRSDSVFLEDKLSEHGVNFRAIVRLSVPRTLASLTKPYFTRLKHRLGDEWVKLSAQSYTARVLSHALSKSVVKNLSPMSSGVGRAKCVHKLGGNHSDKCLTL